MANMKNKLLGCFTLGALVCVQSMPALAQSADHLIEGAKLCTRHLQRYEREHGIPAHLLSAIASTESGRYHEGLKIKLPWPWTINAEGKGYFFDTKEEAIAAANKLYARGVESMDVGCMQVNLHHHPEAFSSLSQAFEPENNVAYAASFLRNLYQDDGSWKKAAGDYHSKTPHLGSQYVGLVYNSWFKIVDKLRSARLSVPSNSINAMNEMKQADITPPAAVTPAVSSPKYINVTEQKAKNFPAYKTPQMKTIKVASQGTVENNRESRRHNNGIIIVKPEITVVGNNTPISNVQSPPEPMIMADATAGARQSILDLAPSAGSVTAIPTAPITTPEAKIIRIDNKLVDRRPVNAQINKKSGPNFIFNN